MSIEEYVPTEAETSSDHWSKSPEYLKEKAAREGKFLNAVNTVPVKDRRTTHEITQASFIVEYVPTEAEKQKKVSEYEDALHVKDLPSIKNILAEYDANVEKQLEEIARVILDKVNDALPKDTIG